MKYEIYATDASDYPTVIDRLFGWLGKSRLFPGSIASFHVVGSVLLGIGIFVVGLAASTAIDLPFEYLKSPAFYLGSIGITLVLATIRTAADAGHGMYAYVRPIFLLTDQEYNRHIHPWFDKLTDTKAALATSGILFSFAVVLVYIALSPPTFIAGLHLKSLHPTTFRPSWFQPRNKVGKSLVIGWFALWDSLCLGTSLRMLYVNLGLFRYLRGFRVIPLPNVIRSRFRPVTNMYVFCSVAWSGGVLLFVLLFYRTVDIVSLIVMGCLATIGILMFLVPQLVFRGFVLSAYRDTCGWALEQFYDSCGIMCDDKSVERTLGGPWVYSENTVGFADLIQGTVRPNMWVYDARDVVLLFVAQLFAVVTVVVQVLLSRGLHL